MSFYTQIICPSGSLVKISSNDTTADYLFNKLVAGSNITLTILNPGGNEEIEIASSVGGAIQTPTGTVNGTNTIFTFTRVPTVIFVDGGRGMKATSSDGTVNWTVVGLVVTLVVAPNFDIWGF